MTKIEWTGRTINPYVGCSLASPGCTNCYAMRQASRNALMMPAGNHYEGVTQASKAVPVWTGRINAAPDHTWYEPLRRRKSTLYFVNSMSDVFHESVPDAWIDRLFSIMALCPQHTFQVLTKRSKRMREYMSDDDLQYRLVCVVEQIALEKISDKSLFCIESCDEDRGVVGTPRHWLLPNVWLGVSCEDQKRADERIPDLLATPAAVRFVSAEPLLGRIDFTRICVLPKVAKSLRSGIHLNALAGKYVESGVPYIGEWDIEGPYPKDRQPRSLDWIIVGGESGPNARPMHPDWVRSIRDQCKAAGTAFFFKQWGSWCPRDDENALKTNHFTYLTSGGATLSAIKGREAGAQKMMRIGKKAAGRLLDGVEHNEMPECAQCR